MNERKQPERQIIYRLKEDTGCMECISHIRDKGGYPITSYYGVTCSVPRLVYMLTYGPVPEGTVVRHICDNPA